MNNIYAIQLILTKGIGEKAIKRAIRFLQNTPGCDWNSLCSPSSNLWSFIDVSQNIVESFFLEKEHSIRIYNQLHENQIQLIFENEGDYPRSLKNALGDDVPPFLFVKGNVKLLNSSGIGFCGSRRTSPKGLTIASECAKQITVEGFSIISGYASGTDMAVHKYDHSFRFAQAQTGNETVSCQGGSLISLR